MSPSAAPLPLVAVLDDWEGLWASSQELARLRDVATLRIFADPVERDVLAREVPAAEVLVLNRERTRVDAALLTALPRLRAIVNTGSGINHIDRDATEKAGVGILTTGGFSHAVVEQTMALMLAGVKKLPQFDAEMRAGTFATRPLVGDLFGKRLGIAGIGSIGSGVALAAKAFGMRVAAWSPSLDDAKAASLGVERRATLVDLAANSDVFSVNIRYVPATRGIVSATVIGALPAGAVFVNTARAELTDTAALIARAERGELRLALDVYDNEPSIDPRYAAVAAALSPHVGWKSEGTWAAFIRTGVERILEALAPPV